MMGDTARTHDVYFGTDANDVNEATVDDPRAVLVGKDLTVAAYDLPGLLDYNETYYWRVDEIEADGTTVYRGPVWSFTAVNFILLDDFERCTDTTLVETWTEWRVPLQEFAGRGVNLSDVSTLAIGVGTKGDTKTPGGSGLLYFDDMRLYRP